MTPAPRILFVGWPDVVHNLRWMTLAEELGFETSLFPLNGSRNLLRGTPSGDGTVAPDARRVLLTRLSDAARDFGADIVHGFGLDPAGLLLTDTARTLDAAVVLQIRGGPEVALYQYDSWMRTRMREAIAAADAVLADTAVNLSFAEQNGLSAEARSHDIGPVPGGGGLDFKVLRGMWVGPPSTRGATIVWPKAFVTPSVDAFAVAEGLRRAWDQAPGFQLQLFFAVHEEFLLWLRRAWPGALWRSAGVRGLAPHDEVIAALCAARIMLAPSLLDGMPNVLLEAAACGALPIVSPHPTLPTAILEARSITWADNLDPAAIATALVTALTVQPGTCDGMAEANHMLVKAYGDRAAIRARVGHFYHGILLGRRDRRS